MIFDLSSPSAKMNGRMEKFLYNLNHDDIVLDRSEADLNVLSFLISKKKKILFLNGDINLEKNARRLGVNFEVKSDPWWYIQSQVSIDQFYTDTMQKMQNDFNYNVIFLSGEPRLSRILTLNELHSYDKFVYSNYNPMGFHNKGKTNLKKLEIKWFDDDHVNWKVPLTPEVLTNMEFKISSNNFDSTTKVLLNEEWQHFTKDNGEQSVGLLSYVPCEYWESVIDLVGESYTIGSSLTEKTFKPLYWKKPFLILGGPGVHSFLKENGFELYDEIFDYSFDKKPFRLRWESIMNQIKNILQMKTTDILKKINLNKIEHNYNMIKDVRSRPKKFTF